jgi:hypothetical protein
LLAMGCIVVQTPLLEYISLVILHTNYAKRRLNDSTAHGYAYKALRAHGGAARGRGAARAGADRGQRRARSHCSFVPPSIHFIP